MITKIDRQLIKECGQEYLMEIVINSKVIKEQTSFLEHIKLCSYIKNLSYEDVVKITITEDVGAFEGKFKKFLKYSFAAIAGSSFFGLAPPISMFALYIYRKLNDTCEKKCYANIPFSTKRKICKYQCQLDIARKVADDLRSDIAKCDEFRNPDTCEKKLRKEYIKWAQRVQQLQIKIRQSEINIRKAEKPEFKGVQRRAENLVASLNLSPVQISEFICKDKKLRESLTFKNHLLLYEQFSLLSKKKVEIIVKPPEIDPRKEEWLRRIIAIGLLPIPIPLLSALMIYVMKKTNFSCLSKCLGQKKFSQKLCYSQCNWLSTKDVVKKLETEFSKCKNSKDIQKCQNKALKLLEEWKQKEVESKIKFDSQLRIEYKQLQTKKTDEEKHE